MVRRHCARSVSDEASTVGDHAAKTAVIGLHAEWVADGKSAAVIYVCGHPTIAERVLAEGEEVGLSVERGTMRVESLATIRRETALSQATLGVGQRLAAGLRVAQRLGQLIPARVAVALVFLAVDLLGSTQDVFDPPAVGAVLIHRRVRLELRPIDRDHPDRHQARLPTQPQHLTKQPSDLRFMTAAELRDRRMIRAAHHRDHLERHVLPTRPLDLARGPDPAYA
jgi:hypothetical protein